MMGLKEKAVLTELVEWLEESIGYASMMQFCKEDGMEQIKCSMKQDTLQAVYDKINALRSGK